MAWRGFITESKAWTGYPKRKAQFWLRLPLASFRFFVVYPLRDWLARFEY